MHPRTKKALILAVKLSLTVLVFWALLNNPMISLSELVAEVKAIDPARFVPWLLPLEPIGYFRLKHRSIRA